MDIKVIDEKSPYLQNLPVGTARDYSAAAEKEKALEVFDEDVRNPIPFDDFTFEGAAYLKSTKDPAGLTLVNSSEAPFARSTVHFDPPLDLRKAKIRFFAKGARGGENIAVALKDQENIQAFLKGKYYPFKQGLTSNWQRAEIRLSEVVKDFDAKNVTDLRFDFGSKDTENKPGDVIFVKDLEWIPS